MDQDAGSNTRDRSLRSLCGRQGATSPATTRAWRLRTPALDRGEEGQGVRGKRVIRTWKSEGPH